MKTVVITWDNNAQGLVERLGEIADPLPFAALFTLPGSRPLLVAVSGDKVRMRLRPGFGGNDFAPVLQGRLSQKDGVTFLTAHFDTDRHVRVFMYVWLAGAAAFGAFAYSTSQRPFVWFLAIAGMLVFGLVMPRVLARLARNDKAEIVALLKEGLGHGAVATSETA